MELAAGHVLLHSIPPKLSSPRHVTSVRTGIIFGSYPDKAITMASDCADKQSDETFEWHGLGATMDRTIMLSNAQPVRLSDLRIRPKWVGFVRPVPFSSLM